MSNQSLLSVLVCLGALSGCAIISRDAGYQRPESNIQRFYFGRNTSLIQNTYSSPDVPVNEDESISLTVSVHNRALMEYSIGPLLPVIPIFWLPGYKAGLSANEKITINCRVGFNVGRKYLEPIVDRPGFFRTNDAGVGYLNSRRSLGKDKCVEVTVELSGGHVIEPESIDLDSGSFVFDIRANEVNSLKVIAKDVKLVTGELVKVKVEGDFKFYDLIRFQLTSPN